MDLQLRSPETFSFKRDKSGAMHFSLPSAGVVLLVAPDEADLVTNEVERFFRETMHHCRYVLKRFSVQYSYLATHINCLRSEGSWEKDGFTKKALIDHGEKRDRDTFNYNVERYLESMAYAHSFSRDLRDHLQDFSDIVDANSVLSLWPSILASDTLPNFLEEDYKGSWDTPFRFTSSGTLVGLVKPIIFHDQTLDISLNSGKVKLYVKGQDAISLIENLFDDTQREQFDTAKQAWGTLTAFSQSVTTFINTMKANGYNAELDCFDDENLNVAAIHEGLVKLEKSLSSESAMLNTDA